MSDIRAEIYSQYKILIYNYFYKATLNSYTAEELTGDTFLKAFRYFNSFRGQSEIAALMHAILKREKPILVKLMPIQVTLCSFYSIVRSLKENLFL